jgi:riboflavin transporter FmnP
MRESGARLFLCRIILPRCLLRRGFYIEGGFLMSSTKRITTYAMLSAMAFALMFLIRFPIMPAAPHMTYDPKDVIIVIGGFLFGPVAALVVAVVVALVEMVTVSTTAYFGLVMNILSSVAFACTACAVYKYKRSMAGAVIGLLAGIFTVSSVMLLANYFIVPLFLPFVTREAAAAMLVPVVLPFNVIKSGFNAAVILLLYKPVVIALRKAGLYEAANEASSGKIHKGLMLAAGAALVSIAVVVMIMNGVIFS